MNSLSEARESLKIDQFDSVDEDIRDIFIEESQEVLQDMEARLPIWSENPTDFTPLTEIRRGFHTLKGSGRMVGANSIGEMAWAVENLLNRVLDNNVAVSDELVEFINELTEVIPVLVNNFANSEAPSIDPAIIVLMAENIRQGRGVTEGLAEPDAAVEQPVEDIEQSPEQFSTEIIEERATAPVMVEDATIPHVTQKVTQPISEASLENPVSMAVTDSVTINTSSMNASSMNSSSMNPNDSDININDRATASDVTDVSYSTQPFESPQSSDSTQSSESARLSKATQPTTSDSDSTINKKIPIIMMVIAVLAFLMLMIF